MKKRHLLRWALAALLLPGVVEAGDWRMSSGKSLPPLDPPVTKSCLSYDYLDLQYVHHDYGSSYLGDSDGYGIAFRKSLGQLLYFDFAFSEGDYDYDWVDHVVPVNTKSYRFGVGARKNIAECVDLTFEGGARHLDASYGGGYDDHDYDSWGWFFGPGVRAKMGRLEVYAKALYYGNEGDYRQEYLSHHTTNYGRVDDYGWVFEPGLIYHVSDNVGVKFGLEIDDYDTSYLAGVRVHF